MGGFIDKWAGLRAPLYQISHMIGSCVELLSLLRRIDEVKGGPFESSSFHLEIKFVNSSFWEDHFLKGQNKLSPRWGSALVPIVDVGMSLDCHGRPLSWSN